MKRDPALERAGEARVKGDKNGAGAGRVATSPVLGEARCPRQARTPEGGRLRRADY
ncbi:MAG TPA: hypothetical protein VEA99_06960 [Gemmatimonadaceae bacterium]|nr:hypothetical protein [Gemmatimonadaceae bacterium]